MLLFPLARHFHVVKAVQPVSEPMQPFIATASEDPSDHFISHRCRPIPRGRVRVPSLSPCVPAMGTDSHITSLRWLSTSAMTHTLVPEETLSPFICRDIYANADEDTRRAMVKSYVESNGTSLSTNWQEVGSKTMETLPPQGMEPKKI